MQARQFLIYLLLFSFLLPSCNTARRAEAGKLRKKSSSFLLKKINNNRFEADWMTTKGRIEFEGQGQKLSAITNITLQKDSLIWMNVKKLSIEVARVLITPDSVFVLNRLSREYIATDLKYLEDRFSIPLDFYDLQELLLGNAVIKEADKLKADVQENKYRLAGMQAGSETTYWLNGLTFLPEQIKVMDPERTWKFTIDQKAYGTEKAYENFSYLRNFAIDSKDIGKMNVSLKFTKIELNVPKNTKFEIPRRYTKMAY